MCKRPQFTAGTFTVALAPICAYHQYLNLCPITPDGAFLGIEGSADVLRRAVLSLHFSRDKRAQLDKDVVI